MARDIKVLFLDMDGVMNSPTQQARDLKLIFIDMDGVLNNDSMEWDTEKMGFVIDIDAVQTLNFFLDSHPDVFLVLSSDWRAHPSAGIGKTIACLEEHGFRHALRFIGETPLIRRSFDDTTGRRWQEIQAWLKVSGPIFGNVTHFAALDDCRWLFEEHISPTEEKNHLVITDHMVGLCQKDMDKVEELLNV